LKRRISHVFCFTVLIFCDSWLLISEIEEKYVDKNNLKSLHTCLQAKPGQTFCASIVKCHSDVQHKSTDTLSGDNNSTSSSPSSDKENKGRQTLITDIFKSG